MKIKSIIIEFEPNPSDKIEHASRMTFGNGTWIADGPVLNRFLEFASELWKLLRAQLKKEEGN